MSCRLFVRDLFGGHNRTLPTLEESPFGGAQRCAAGTSRQPGREYYMRISFVRHKALLKRAQVRHHYITQGRYLMDGYNLEMVVNRICTLFTGEKDGKDGVLTEGRSEYTNWSNFAVSWSFGRKMRPSE